MAKLAITVLVLRALQLALATAFTVFWIWSIASAYVVGGGIGAYFLGFFAAVVSLAICGHGIWHFARKQHLAEHRALYRHGRWILDVFVVVLWLGVILLQVLLPVPQEYWNSQLGGGPSLESSPSAQPSATDPIIVVGMGVNITVLFSVITFFITALLLFFAAILAPKVGGGGEASRGKTDAADRTIGEHGIQEPQAAHFAPQSEKENTPV